MSAWGQRATPVGLDADVEVGAGAVAAVPPMRGSAGRVRLFPPWFDAPAWEPWQYVHWSPWASAMVTPRPQASQPVWPEQLYGLDETAMTVPAWMAYTGVPIGMGQSHAG